MPKLSDKLAVQMYTIRDFTTDRQSLHNSLRKISELGYKAVQFSAVQCMNGGSPQVNARDARDMLDEFGLRYIATHRSWNDLVSKTDEEIAFHKTLGCDYAAIGGIDKNYPDTITGYRSWLKDAAKLVKALKTEGIRFGHHNHSREFVRPCVPGPTLEDILIDEGGSDLMLELDLYWVIHAGADPCRLLRRCAGRVPVIHLKDKEVLPGTNDGIIAPIGEGVIDWEGIIPVCEKCGVDWYAIEQDTCRRDPFDCLRSSFACLSQMKV
ncbi:MAG: sugar phosphate isomerase/epimerase [Verrucomicrobiae bacterium]|nr:sugar phosphate isomerase/epimerase [Verrucomicrobiae bacterium]